MKVVYLYDGTPYLAELNEEGEYDYPKEAWTEVPPPEGIYEPFYFNGNEWIGSTKEEWETNNKNDMNEPNVNDQLNLQLITNDIEQNMKIDLLQQDIANLTKQLLDIQGGLKDVSNT